MTRGLWPAFLAMIVLWPEPAAAGVQPAWFLETRVRWDVQDPVAEAEDAAYSFWNGRLRGGLRLRTGEFRLDAIGQAAASLALPEEAQGGAGARYRRANGGETGPGRVSLLELNLVYDGPRLDARLGRMRYADGNERSIPLDRLDAVKRRRVAERLIGDRDWTNVGRRFDGGTAGLDMTLGRIDVLFLVPLAGGYSYRDAQEWIDDVHLFGVSLTNEYDSALPKTELRFSAYQIHDDRAVLRDGFWEAPGAEIDVTTAVLSLVTGGARSDILFWLAAQNGDWGLRAQDAVALVLESGWRLGRGGWRPALRLGYAQASGWNGRDARHTTFYNLMPSGHKFHGSLDLNAFQNLRDLRLEFSMTPHPRVSARLTGHAFWLVHVTDAWYRGSGAYNTAEFGYTARRPAHGGDFGSRNIGAELDLDLSVRLPRRFLLEAGGAAFFGGRVAEESYPARNNAVWVYIQLTASL